MKVRIIRCQIEDIADWYPQLFLDAHIAACVSVLTKYSESPARLNVECQDLDLGRKHKLEQLVLEISWCNESAVKGDRLRATVQSNQLVEMAATTIALALVHRVISLKKVEVTDHGDRADYRSRHNDCVLEISGTESVSQLPLRHRAKIAQALENPYGWDAYVVVCAFSQDGHYVRFSQHSAKESENG